MLDRSKPNPGTCILNDFSKSMYETRFLTLILNDLYEIEMKAVLKLYMLLSQNNEI